MRQYVFVVGTASVRVGLILAGSTRPSVVMADEMSWRRHTTVKTNDERHEVRVLIVFVGD